MGPRTTGWAITRAVPGRDKTSSPRGWTAATVAICKRLAAASACIDRPPMERRIQMTRFAECSWLCLFCAVTAIASPAQTFTRLASFDSANGANPQLMSLVQGTDGNFYGTTPYGGGLGVGEVFEVTSGGAVTELTTFGGTTAG